MFNKNTVSVYTIPYVEVLDSTLLYIEIVDLLLEHDAMLKTKNSDGWIPLDEAISYGSREMSETLIARQLLDLFSVTVKPV